MGAVEPWTHGWSMTESMAVPRLGRAAHIVTTALLVLLLVGLVVVGGAALALSARPIVVVAAELGVPWGELGSPDAAIVAVEGAVLVLTALWLHPWTRQDVRNLARVGAFAGLCLSASAGVVVYGPAGVIPALIYFFVVHTWSRAILAHLTSASATITESPLVPRRVGAWVQRVAKRGVDAPAQPAPSATWGSAADVEAVTAHIAAPESTASDSAENEAELTATPSAPAMEQPVASGKDAASTGAPPRLHSVPRVERKRTREELDAAAKALPEQFRVTRKSTDPLPVFRARVEAAERAARRAQNEVPA